MFITSNAAKGLAQYRALQSRLHPLVTAVEAEEVVKLGFGTDFQLLSAHQESTNIARFSLYIQSIKDTKDIYEKINDVEEFSSGRISSYILEVYVDFHLITNLDV